MRKDISATRNFLKHFILIAASPIFIILFFLTMQIWVRGISIFDSAKLALWFLSNLIIGSWIYINLVRRHTNSLYELIAIGSIIGIVLSAIIDQVFVGFGFVGFTSKFWMAIAICLVIYYQKNLNDVMKKYNSAADSSILLSIFIATLVPLAAIDYISGSSLLVFSIVGVCFTLKFFDKIQTKLLYAAVALSSLLQLHLTRHINGIPKVLLPLSTGSDDQIKSEQLAFSIANWGLNTKSSAIGFPVKFHWLSLAWSGSLSTGVLSDPFEVTLHFVPIVGILLAAISASALAIRISRVKFVWLISPFIMVAGAGISGREKFFFVLTTTNLIPHLFVIGLFFFVLNYLEDQNNVPIMLCVVIWPSMVLLGKGPYVVSIVFALMGLLTGFRYKTAKFKNYLVVLSMALFLVITVYYFFLRSTYTDSYTFSIDHIVKHFPSPLLKFQDTSLIVRLGLSLITLLTFVFFRFPVFFFKKQLIIDRRLKNFLIGGCTAAAVSFVAYQSGSETYFMNAALTISAISNIYLLAGIIKPPFAQNETSQRKLPKCSRLLISIFALITTCLALAVIRSGLVSNVSKVMSVASPWILLVFLFSAAVLLTSMNAKFIPLCVIMIPIIFGISNVSTSPLPPNPPFVSDLELYRDIRNIVPKDAVLATNHEVCREVVDCDIGAGMPVSTAFSQRMFLIDGSRSLLPTKYWRQNYPEEFGNRVNAMYRFIDSPSRFALESLKNFGVDWLLVDKNTTSQRKWSEYSSTVWEDSNYALLMLN